MKRWIARILALLLIIGNVNVINSKANEKKDQNIISSSKATAKEMKAWAREKGATSTFINLADVYQKYAKSHGNINPIIAYAQSGLETGFGRFGGVINESYKNPCGMKTAQGGPDSDPNAHQKFKSWDDGVKAHLDHLALYAGATGYPRKETTDPRHFPTIFGKAKTVQALSSSWATDKEYGNKIMRLYKEIESKIENTKPDGEKPNTRPIKENNFTINYQAHGEGYGWQKAVSEGKVAGTTGKWKRMEGIKINLVDAPNGLKVKYRTHSAGDRGFRTWKNQGELSGTTGQSRRLEAIQIKLEGSVAKNYNIEYRAHIEGKGWLSWVKNGQTAGTMGQSKRIEAIQIKLTPTKDVGVEYRAHGQDYAWQKEYKRDGELAGTTGQWRRMEAIRIKLRNPVDGLGVRYATKSKNDKNFSLWKTSNSIAGTTGKSLQMEAIKIELTGKNASKYRIEYRVHGENYGWQSWKKNGQIAGLTGKRIEGIEIRIVN